LCIFFLVFNSIALGYRLFFNFFSCFTSSAFIQLLVHLLFSFIICVQDEYMSSGFLRFPLGFIFFTFFFSFFMLISILQLIVLFCHSFCFDFRLLRKGIDYYNEFFDFFLFFWPLLFFYYFLSCSFVFLLLIS